MSGDPGFTRRAVLLGALAVPLAACRPHRGAGAPNAPAGHPDADTIRQAYAAEDALVQSLSGWADHAAFMQPEQGVHAEHLLALRTALSSAGTTPSPVAPTPTASLPSRLTPAGRQRVLLRRFEDERTSTVALLQGLAESAKDGEVAALLASVAACHSSPLAWAGFGVYAGGGGS
jgi:hypothetical protein